MAKKHAVTVTAKRGADGRYKSTAPPPDVEAARTAPASPGPDDGYREPTTDRGAASVQIRERADAAEGEASAPDAPFLLVFDPQRWQVFEGRIVPLLSDLRLINGFNGVQVDRNGAVDLSAWRQNNARRPPSRRRILLDQGKVGSYLRRDPTGRHHLRFQTYSPTTGRLELLDREGYAAWLESLVAEGHVPPPAPDVVRKLRGQLEQVRKDHAKSARDGSEEAEKIRTSASAALDALDRYAAAA